MFVLIDFVEGLYKRPVKAADDKNGEDAQTDRQTAEEG